MNKTKIYLLGPVSPWNVVRSEDFQTTAGKLRKLGFEVKCCADFAEQDKAAFEQVNLFRQRLDAALETKYLILMENYQRDEEAIAIANTASFSGVKTYGYDDFLKNHESYVFETAA